MRNVAPAADADGIRVESWNTLAVRDCECVTINKSAPVPTSSSTGPEQQPILSDGMEWPLDFAIIGAQKAATSSLHATLAQVPTITMMPHEVRVFEDPLYSDASVRHLMDGLRVIKADRGGIVGIRHPNYLTLDYAPERLRARFPQLKVIGVLRDPSERAVSAYFHLMNHGHMPVQDPELAFRALLDGRHDRRFPRSSEILEFSTYAPGIRRYMEQFSSDRTLWLGQAEVVGDMQTAVGRTCDFLGVDRVTVNIQRENEGHYSIPRVRWFRRLSDPWISSDDTGMVIHGRQRLPYRASRSIDRRLFRRLFPSPPSRDVLPPALWQQLDEYFAADVAEVKALTGVELRTRAG